MVNATHTTATTKNVVVAHNLNRLLNAALIGFFASWFLMFAVHPVFGLCVTIGSSIAMALLSSLLKREMSQFVRDTASDFEASCRRHGVTYKPNYSDTELGLFLGLSEEDAVLFIQSRRNTLNAYEFNERIIKLRDIMNVELIVNDLSVYKAGSIASLSVAAIGGIAFGGAGAIVGSLSSGQVGNGKIGTATLKLRANNINEPLIEIPFINKSVKASSTDAQARLGLAEKWTNLIEVMRFRLAQSSAVSSS